MICAHAQRLLCLLPEPALVVTPAGDILAANPAFLDLLGEPHVPATGSSLLELCPTEPKRLRAFLHLCAGAQQLLPGTLVLRTRTGRMLALRCEGGCLTGPGQAEPLLLVRFKNNQKALGQFLQPNAEPAGLPQEMAARKQAEAASRQDEALFRQLADALPQIVWTARANGYIDYYNQRWYDFTGFPHRFGDESWLPVLHPQDLQRCVETYYQSIRDGHPYQIEYRFWDRQHQNYRWFLGRALPVRDEAGRIIRWFGTCTDIDDLKRAEETRARLAAIVESSTDAIVSKTPEGIVTTWNRGAERIFGYTAEEMIGQSITRLIPADHLDEEQAILERIRRGERLEHYTTVRQRKDDTLIDVSLSVSPIKDAAGKVIGASKIARDITQQKHTERALTEARQALCEYAATLEQRVQERTVKLQETIQVLDSFCYTIAHDLRTPLHALGGFSKELSLHYAGLLDAQGKDYLQRIAEAAARMDQLILDLLRLGRLSTLELTSETVDVEDLVHRALQPLEAEIQSKNAQVRLHAPLLRLHANPVLLEQALTNLLGNALKFVRPKTPPRVAIWTEDHAPYVRLYVQDNGIGIKPAHLKKLFQPFMRLVSNERYAGTGIGLAIVRKAVERMGGRVGVESEPGKGSCFWLELPRAMDQTCSSGQSASQAGQGHDALAA